MKFTLDSKTMNAGISTVIKALSSRPSLPILEGVYIETVEQGVLLKCSDLTLQIECILPANVEEEGSTVAPGRLFCEMARKLPDQDVEFELVGAKTLNMVCGRAKTSMQCANPAEFPDMTFTGDQYAISLPQKELRDMIRQTVFSTAQEDSKPILTGVLIELNEDTLSLVALDGFRLALRRTVLKMSGEGEKEAVVPAKSINEIARILTDSDETVQLSFTKTHVQMDLGHTRVMARLLDGNFIRYRQILPTTQNTRVRVSRVELLESIERAMLLAREGNNNLVRFSIALGHLQLTANSSIGSIDENISVEINGNDIEIAFNARYFSDVLKVLEDEYIYLDMNNNVSPCVVRSIQGDGFYYLILPVRIFS